MMRRYIERFRCQATCHTRIAAACLCFVFLMLAVVPVAASQGTLTVSDDSGNSQTILAGGIQPQKVLPGLDAMADFNDQVVVEQTGPAAASVTIRQAFPARVRADKTLYDAEMVDGTVADLLKTCKITLEGEDFVEPALDTPLTREMTAVVHRVTYEEEKTRTEVDQALVDEYYAQLLLREPDTQFVMSNSGIYDVTYKHRLVDGKVEESVVEKLIPIITPRDPGSTAFIPGVPCSTIEGFDDIELGENGLPTNYKRLWQGVRCTAYSSSGGRGASGLGLYCGTVAVNPNVIPYGTRLYITEPGGNFVYGYAIATDTGVAMMQGVADLDLYFATYEESVRFGVHWMDVYILD